MRYAKQLGLIAIAIVGSMVFAATASAATKGTDSAGGSTVEVLDTIHASSSADTELDGTINVTCKKSTIGGVVTNSGSGITITTVAVETLTLEECGSNTVAVVRKGTLDVETDGAQSDGNGEFRSYNAEITVLTHNILGTVHCIYVTNGTDIGKLDGSNNTGGTATLTVDSVPIPRTSTDFGCGSTSELTAEYTVSTPDYLAID